MRKKIKYYSITNGHIVSAWHILHLTNLYKGISVKIVVDIVEKSGKLGGTTPAKQGIKICNDYGLLRFQDEQLFATEVSETHILPKCDFEDPNIEAQRALLFHILSYHSFEWLIFFDADQEIFRESILANDPEWVNLLDNAKLFDFEDENVNVWWDGILSKYTDYKEKTKKAIGDVGEKLTYHFELERVEGDGYESPKTYVKWASRISDRFGFDVQSIRSRLFLSSFEAVDKIQVEVKSSDTNAVDRFRFFISKPEWNKALENIDSYFFFCWTGVNIDKESAEQGPFVIPASDLLTLVPEDKSEIMQWSECRCIMDISQYAI